MDDKRKPGVEKPTPPAEKGSPPDEEPGEGSRSADRRYRENLREFEEQHDVEALARAARREIEKDPDAYRAAEEAGKRRMAEEDPEVLEKK